MRSMIVMMLFVAVLTIVPTAVTRGEFNTARPFPKSWRKIQVFADQLPVASMSEAQRQFVATRFAGTQKLTSDGIKQLRVYNPDFLMLQYFLGVRTSRATFIHYDTWGNGFSEIDKHEDWFVHDGKGNRVYQMVGEFKEYVMDISGEINGDTAGGWKQYSARMMVTDAIASEADGVFVDSAHLPYRIPSKFHTSPVGPPPHTAYIDDMESYYDWVYPQFDQANKYCIPNIGSLITSADTTTGYYEDVHGAMVELFATRLSASDWRLQANRTLKLIRNDKILIAQNSVSSPQDISGRLWYLGNFLLLKHDKSYVNILNRATESGGKQLTSWPEYDLKLGAPLDQKTPDSISDICDSSGIYARPYEQGFVLVNPTDNTRKYIFPEELKFYRIIPFGGGNLNAQAEWNLPTGIHTSPVHNSITLKPWSAEILCDSDIGEVVP